MNQEKKKVQTIEQYLSIKNTDNFFDFSSGAEIPDEEIENKIIELVREMRIYCKKTAHYSISGGNTTVFAFYDVDEDRIDIQICKNMRETHLYFKEGGIIDTGGIPLHKDPSSKKWRLDHKIIWDN